jgi:3',5'-cyclic AMP phosphodiesterase CpdA
MEYATRISRRSFLAGTAAGASAAMLKLPTARADMAEKRPVILMADPHIAGDPQRFIKDKNLSDQLARSVDRIIQTGPPQMVIINGDLSLDVGLTEDYEQFFNLLEPLISADTAIFYALGNHDHRARFLAERYRRIDLRVPRELRDHLRYPIREGGVQWIVLDSLRETDEIVGAIGDTQLEWLRLHLEQNPEPTFIVVHHNPTDDPEDTPTFAGNGLVDGQALLDLLHQHRQVKALFHGHRHRFQLRHEGDLPIVGLPAIAYPFDKGEPTGYLEAVQTHRELKLTLRTLDPQHPRDGEQVTLVT